MEDIRISYGLRNYQISSILHDPKQATKTMADIGEVMQDPPAYDVIKGLWREWKVSNISYQQGDPTIRDLRFEEVIEGEVEADRPPIPCFQ